MCPNDFIGPRIKAISNLLSQKLSENTAAMDLTATQSFILHFLISHQSQTICQRDIERHFDFSHATASGLLHRLHAKGYISCTPHEKDHRLKLVQPTKKALERDLEVRKLIIAQENALLRGFTTEESVLLRTLLDRIFENLGSAASNCRKENDT